MSDIKSKNIELVDIESIVQNPKNANKHPKEQIERLEKLIKYQGFRNPLIISNRTGFLVVGHGRLEVAKNLGMKKVPVIKQDFENEAQEYSYLISDNEIARWASLDNDLVYEELKHIELEDIELLGIEDFEVPEIETLDPQTDEDEVPEIEHPITRRGDIWLLGNHRLMCGDSTMIDDVEKLMNGEKADMVFTDPPYGISYDSTKNTNSYAGKLKRNDFDIIKGDDRDDFFKECFQYFSYCQEQFWWGANYYCQDLPKNGSFVVWSKKSEAQRGNGALFNSDYELAWSRTKHRQKLFEVSWSGCVNKEKGESRLHPTQKPISIVEKFLNEWGGKSSLIVDIFLGSGTTLLASEKNNKTCYGMELDEKYCDVIINRWQNYTGKKATLELTGQTYEELKSERQDVQ